MRTRGSERALSQMMDELASFDATEMGAILDLLDEEARKQVLTRLERRAGQGDVTMLQQDDETEVPLSAWLRDRVGMRGPMTVTAHAALVSGSREIFSARNPKTRRVGPSLLARVGSSISGKTS